MKLFRFPSKEPEITFTNHDAIVTGVYFSPDGRWLLSTSLDGSARRWDVAARRGQEPSLRGHLGGVWGGAVAPDGRRIATGSAFARDAVKLWDVATHRELLSLQTAGLYYFHLTFSPDGNTLAATSLNGIADLWHAPSWEEIEAAEKGQETR